MNLAQFKRVSREVAARLTHELPRAIQYPDESYWCTSCRIGNRHPRELFLEWRRMKGGHGIRAGLYFKDSPNISNKERGPALQALVAQIENLRRLSVVPTFTSQDESVDHQQFGWSTKQLVSWLADKSDHRDLVRSWPANRTPSAKVIADVLRALIPIWRAWNELDRKAPPTSVAEGELRSIVLELRQRNTAIVRAAREYHGFDCAVCGFNFEKAYGVLGHGYIEVHHNKPVAKGKAQTTIQDLSCVCANCHRVIHRRAVPLSIARLQKIVNERRRSNRKH
jgi:hypothetical protein